VDESNQTRPSIPMLLVPFAVFAIAAVIAELAGAINLGTALGIGQLAFAAAVVVVLLRS
jgi:hypothetical protein